jgi:hypothetical protein
MGDPQGIPQSEMLAYCVLHNVPRRRWEELAEVTEHLDREYMKIHSEESARKSRRKKAADDKPPKEQPPRKPRGKKR